MGKGITTASLGRSLKNRGVKVSIVKIDPYFNIDAGTMNPFEHGEVFVTKDGGEIDQDLDHIRTLVQTGNPISVQTQISEAIDCIKRHIALRLN